MGKFAAVIHMKVSQFYTTLTVLIKGVTLDLIARALKQLLVNAYQDWLVSCYLERRGC